MIGTIAVEKINKGLLIWAFVAPFFTAIITSYWHIKNAPKDQEDREMSKESQIQTPEKPFDIFYKSLDYKFWSTSITLFNASKRINDLQNCLRWSLFAASFHLTTLTILSHLEKINPIFTSHAPIIAIVLSVLLLCLSLANGFSRYSVTSFKYHTAGRAIRRLLDSLKSSKTTDELTQLSSQYNNILDQCDNHSSIDYYQFIFHERSSLKKHKTFKWPSRYLRYVYGPLARFIPIVFSYIFCIVAPLLFIFCIYKY